MYSVCLPHVVDSLILGIFSANIKTIFLSKIHIKLFIPLTVLVYFSCVFFCIGNSRKGRLPAEDGQSGEGMEEALVYSEKWRDLVL